MGQRSCEEQHKSAAHKCSSPRSCSAFWGQRKSEDGRQEPNRKELNRKEPSMSERRRSDQEQRGRCCG